MAAVDRISDLPERTLHHIFSFLSQKDAIQTSALSKTWRRVGPTRPKIELRDRWFQKSGKASFLSVLSNTLQRYNHNNLSEHEFILQMSSDPESISILDKGIPTLLTNTAVKKFDFNVSGYDLDPSLVFRAEFLTELYLSHCDFMTCTTTNNNNNGKPLFKGLKRLSLYEVCIEPETFVQIMLSCRLIEYLRLSDCPSLKTIPETIFQAESLTELDLSECKLTSITQPLLIKRLKTLSLDQVYIPEDTLEEIMCSCPLIECVVLSDCKNANWFHNNINNNPLLSKYAVCLDWYGHDKYFFPRLKTLYLERVNLSAELFESFSSSNFPSLEDLELDNCYGFSEIQLTVSSIKRLAINMDLTERMVININAPNIHCFELSIRALVPELIFHTETGKEWESHVHIVSNNDKVLHLPWLLQLSELLNSLRESQISLDLYSNLFKDLKVENTNDVVFCKPVPVQRVCVDGDGYRSSFFSNFLDCLLLICRPRYIGDMNWYTGTGRKKGKNKLVEFIISEIIRNQGKMSRGYLWERDLEEISMQLWDQKSKGWRNVRVEGTHFPEFNTKIRFPLKWRPGD